MRLILLFLLGLSILLLFMVILPSGNNSSSYVAPGVDEEQEVLTADLRAKTRFNKKLSQNLEERLKNEELLKLGENEFLDPLATTTKGQIVAPPILVKNRSFYLPSQDAFLFQFMTNERTNRAYVRLGEGPQKQAQLLGIYKGDYVYKKLLKIENGITSYSITLCKGPQANCDITSGAL